MCNCIRIKYLSSLNSKLGCLCSTFIRILVAIFFALVGGFFVAGTSLLLQSKCVTISGDKSNISRLDKQMSLLYYFSGDDDLMERYKAKCGDINDDYTYLVFVFISISIFDYITGTFEILKEDAVRKKIWIVIFLRVPQGIYLLIGVIGFFKLPILLFIWPMACFFYEANVIATTISKACDLDCNSCLELISDALGDSVGKFAFLDPFPHFRVALEIGMHLVDLLFSVVVVLLKMGFVGENVLWTVLVFFKFVSMSLNFLFTLKEYIQVVNIILTILFSIVGAVGFLGIIMTNFFVSLIDFNFLTAAIYILSLIYIVLFGVIVCFMLVCGTGEEEDKDLVGSAA